MSYNRATRQSLTRRASRSSDPNTSSHQPPEDLGGKEFPAEGTASMKAPEAATS